jgi:hypothetical protein
VVDVLLTVSVEVSAPPVMLTDAGDIVPQVIGLVAPDGDVVTAHVSATAPVNPLVGLTEMVEVFPLDAPAVMLKLPLFVSVKPGVVLVAPVTMAVKPRVWMYCPVESVPVINTL